MADIDILVLQMSADIRKLEQANARAIANTNKSLKQIEDRFDTMNGKIGKSAAVIGDTLRKAVASIGLTLAVKETIQYADAWTSATNKLAAAGVAINNLNAIQNDLVNLSLQTRTGLTETVDLYAKLQRSTQTLGTSQKDLLRATQIVNEAFKAGGASIEEQKAAILQLGQALSSGALQGDELRSIRENAPLLAQAIAKEFGVTIGQLKNLGAEGKLTTDRIFKGILDAGAQIDAQFKSTTSTIADSFTNLVTASTAAVGRLNEMYGISQAISNTLQGAADKLNGGSGDIQPKTTAALVARGSRDTGALEQIYTQTEALLDQDKVTKELTSTEQKLADKRKQDTIDRLTGMSSELDHLRDYTNALIKAQELEAKSPRVIIEPPNVKYNRQDNINAMKNALPQIREESSRLTDLLVKVIKADSSLFLPVTGTGGAASKLKQYSDALNEFEKTMVEIRASKEDDAIKSRAAEQAVLDYAQASKSVATAYAEIPNIQDVLLGKDKSDLKAKLTDMVDEARVAGLTGFEKLEQDHQRAMDALLKQEKDEAAVGIDNQATNVDRRLALDRDYMEKRGKLIDEMVGEIDPWPAMRTAEADTEKFQHDIERNLDLTAGAQAEAERARFAGARQYSDELLRQAAIIQKTKELENAGFSKDDAKGIAEELVGQFTTLRDNMRSAVKDGLMEGLTTGDWGKAFSSVFASALTTALDKSLNNFADFLTNLLLGNSSSGDSGLINSAINWFTGGQNSASGGPRSPYSVGKVNETGQGEFLFMGNNPGQDLTAAQVNAKVSGVRGGGGMIDASVTFNGPIGADLQQVRQLLSQQKQQIVAAIPYMVDGRVIDSRRHKRYG